MLNLGGMVVDECMVFVGGCGDDDLRFVYDEGEEDDDVFESMMNIECGDVFCWFMFLFEVVVLFLIVFLEYLYSGILLFSYVFLIGMIIGVLRSSNICGVRESVLNVYG